MKKVPILQLLINLLTQLPLTERLPGAGTVLPTGLKSQKQQCDQRLAEHALGVGSPKERPTQRLSRERLPGGDDN